MSLNLVMEKLDNQIKERLLELKSERYGDVSISFKGSGFYCNDNPSGKYDKQLGGYVGSESDRKGLMKEKGLVDIDYESVEIENNKVKVEKEKKIKEKYRTEVYRSVEFLKKNKPVCKVIAAEQRNTGQSATAKKISEALK